MTEVEDENLQGSNEVGIDATRGDSAHSMEIAPMGVISSFFIQNISLH